MFIFQDEFINIIIDQIIIKLAVFYLEKSFW